MLNQNESNVGYRRPPEAHQFKKGVSGNRRGRPKHKPGQQFADLIDRMLERKVRITIDGKKQLVTMAEAIARQFVNLSANGDTGALDLLARLKLHEKGRGEVSQLVLEVINYKTGKVVHRSG